ncbi:MAG: tetratricopeptide repeat protein, partial [bacterium]|nr:tetratricopeptide repeat protein [bacterium]
VMLKKKLTGKQMMKRSRKIDADSRSKLKSLGYLSGSSSQKKDVFTKEFDLKTMLPQQNRMQDAMNKYQKGMVEVPVAELKKILEKSPSFILVYKHIATILKESGRLNQAIEILRQGLKKNPGNPGLMAKLGIMLTEARNPAEAIELLEACVQQESFDPEHFNFLGVAYYKSGNFKLALANYQKALQLDNNYASAFNNIGSLYLVVYLKQKEEQAYRLALENFSRALEIDPRLFAAYNGRGAAYKFKNKIDLAIEDWKKTIEINPNFIDAYFNIGISCLEKGDKKTSLKYLLLCRDKFASKLPPREKQRLARLLAEARK